MATKPARNSLPTVDDVHRHLLQLANPERARILQRFFKTGPGQYAEGDRFLGMTVPQVRKLARQFRELSLADIRQLLKSSWHEERLLALLILIHRYAKGDEAIRQRIYTLYLKHTRYINNWDLVDVSAEHIIGAHLFDQNSALLDDLAKSTLLWDRRIAIMATFHFIRRQQFEPTLRIAEMLLSDPHDLIHKAVGWMLREVGKRDIKVEKQFLRQHCRTMPRTMLRYAIERFPPAQRLCYLKGTIPTG